MKCIDDSCNKEGTEKRRQGSEEFYYCKNHAAWWDKLMGHCY